MNPFSTWKRATALTTSQTLYLALQPPVLEGFLIGKDLSAHSSEMGENWPTQIPACPLDSL